VAVVTALDSITGALLKSAQPVNRNATKNTPKLSNNFLFLMIITSFLRAKRGPKNKTVPFLVL